MNHCSDAATEATHSTKPLDAWIKSKTSRAERFLHNESSSSVCGNCRHYHRLLRPVDIIRRSGANSHSDAPFHLLNVHYIRSPAIGSLYFHVMNTFIQRSFSFQKSKHADTLNVFTIIQFNTICIEKETRDTGMLYISLHLLRLKKSSDWDEDDLPWRKFTQLSLVPLNMEEWWCHSYSPHKYMHSFFFISLCPWQPLSF